MLNFNVIAVTTDLSDYSKRALPYAISMAERFEADLKIISVVEPTIPVSDVAWVGVDTRANDDELVRQTETVLAEIIREQVPRGIDVEAKVLVGNAVENIIGYARDNNVDLLVICTHGRTGLSHVLLGSTSEAIVRRAPCPVLTLRQPMTVAGTQHHRNHG
jgi:nucleotide-binding universal stress UspA family protein